MAEQCAIHPTSHKRPQNPRKTSGLLAVQKYHAARKVSVPEADISAISYNKTEIMTAREILTRKLNSSKKKIALIVFVFCL